MKRICFLAMFFGAYISSFAQTGMPHVYTLDEAVETALKNNPQMRVAMAQRAYNDADFKAAFGEYLPTVSGSFNYQRLINSDKFDYTGIDGQKIKADANSYSMSIGATYSLFDGFSREANYSRAQTALKGSKLDYFQTAQNVVMDVHKYYMNVVKNSQIVNARKENLELGRATLEKLKAQFQAGVIAETVVYSQEAELGNNEIELISAENLVNTSKAQLFVAMGLDANTIADFDMESIPSSIPEAIIKNFRTEIGSFDQALEVALKARYDYQSAKLNLESAEYSKKMVYGAYYPTLSANGQWNWSNTEFNAINDLSKYYVGLSLNIPIFTNYKTDLSMQSAELRIEQQKSQLIQIEQAIRTNVQLAYLNMISAEKQIEISEKSLKYADINYESVKERLAVGSANITELITANTQLITAKINKITANYSYEEARKDLLYSMGKLTNVEDLKIKN